MRARVRTARAVRQRVSLSLSHPYPNPYPYSGILSPPSFSAVFFRPLFLLLILILILIPPFFLRRSLSARCLFRILILTLILVPHVSVGSGRHFAREFLGARRWRWVHWTRHRSFHRVACKATLFHRGDELSTLILVPHVSVGSGRHFAREFLGARRWRWVHWTRHRSFHRVACKATLFHRGDELSTGCSHATSWRKRFVLFSPTLRTAAAMTTSRCAPPPPS
jgi:hypothetical protein